MREKSKIGFLKINLFKKKAVKFSAFLLIAGLFFYALFSVGIAYAKDINFGSTSDKILLNGNVGVGTTNPNFKFSVSGVATNGVETVANFSNPITATAALGNGPAISLGRSDGSYSAKIATIYEGNNPSWLQPSLAFYTMRDTYLPGSEVERMRISSTGNVGIGTTNPGARLTASGAANSDLMTLGTASGIFGALAANGLYGLYTGVSNDGHVWMQVGRNDSNAATYPLVFNPGGGNVGVGNTAPAYKLDVTGNGAFRSGDNSYLYFGPNASWGGALYVGATPNKIGSRTAQVVASDGNLHIDSGTYAGNDIYLNYYNTGHNIRAFGPLNMGSNQITNLATPGVGSDAATKGYVDSAVTSGNASTVGGLSVHAGRNNEANKIVRTDVSGYLQTGYINSSNGDESNNSNPTKVWGTNGSDSYLRTYYTSALSVSNSDMVDGWHRDDIRAWGNLTGKPVGLANMPDTGQGASSAWSMA